MKKRFYFVSIHESNSYLDHFSISPGTVKTPCQIFNDATLIVYYPFDSYDTWLDRSVNLFHGYASRVTPITGGRVQQAISFETTISFYQALCFPTIRPASLPFSVSLWIQPMSGIASGSLVHISTLQNGTGSICYDLLGFTGSGALVAQIMSSSTLFTILGPVLPTDAWTHLAVVYSPSNGYRLFINGQLIGSVVTTIVNYSFNLYVTLGNNSPGLNVTSSTCVASSIVAGAYRGSMDEFRIYNRELDAQELCVLAHM